jgi:hypothetical protein
MKSRLTLLLCGTVLIAVAPVWADRATPGDEFAGGGRMGVGSSLAMDFHSASSGAIDSHARFTSSAIYNWKTRVGEREWKRRRDEGTATATVPEPGSLPLILLGLAGVGFLARRRRDLPSTI